MTHATAALTEQIISQLYRATGLGDIAGFRRQALTELAQVIAFDGGQTMQIM